MATTNSAKIKAYQEHRLEDRDQIILEHLPQIRYIAQRILRRLPPEVQLDDLVSAGVIGLLDAYEKYDETRGVKFKTYAEVRIRGEILDSLRELDWAPRSLRSRGKEIENAYSELEQRFHRPASDQEVADKLKISLSALHALLDQLNGLTIGHFQEMGVDGDRHEDEGAQLQYVNGGQSEDSPFETVQKRELRRILADIIEDLPEREQLILSLYYQEELTMKEIGHILGVNESRVSQLHTRAVLRMRAKLQGTLKKEARAS